MGLHLLLHERASMAGLAETLASDARSVLVTLPGFDGQPQPGWLDTVGGLVLMTRALLDALGLDAAVLVGNSAGGWTAAEVACRRPTRLGGLVLIDAVGLDPTDTAGGIANPIAAGPDGAARIP